MKTFRALIIAMAAAVLCSACRDEAAGLREVVAAAIEDVAQHGDSVVFAADSAATAMTVHTVFSPGDVTVNVYTDTDNSWRVAVAASVSCFLFSLGAVWVVFYYLHKMYRDRCRVLYEAMIAGRTLPGADRTPDATRTFRRGVAWTAAGVGGAAFFLAAGTREMAALMLIPLIVGAGRITAFFFIDRTR